MFFKLIDIITISGAIQGLFLVAFLVRKKANKYLTALIIMATVMLFGRGFFFHYPRNWPYQLVFIPDTIIFLFGPYLYFYFRSIMGMEVRKPILHFVPAILHLLAIVYVCQYSNEELRTMEYNGSLTLWYSASEIAGLISGIFYTTISIMVLKGKRALAVERSRAKSLVIFAGMIYLVMAGWLLSILQTYFNYRFYYLNYNLIWVILPFLIYFFAYYTMSGSKKVSLPIKNQLNVIPGEELLLIKERIEQLMNDDHMYQNCELSLTEVASELNLTANKTSWYFNQVYHESFNDFINRLRLEAFIKMVEKGAHNKLTIHALAYECGFNSKSTFNKVFKEKMNTTPSDYIRSKNV